MQNFKISMKDGRVFFNKALVLGEGTVSSAKDILASELPMKVDIIRCNGTKDGMELSLGKMVIDAEYSPYLQKEYIKSYEDFTSGTKMIFNRDTKEISLDGEFDLESVLSEDNLDSDEWLQTVIEFMMYVMMHRNPYVYNLFTERTPKSKKFARTLWHKQVVTIIKNLYKNLDKLDNLEKVAKTIGEDFIFENITGEFELNNAGKKLHQVVEIPLVVASGIKKLRIEEAYNDFKIIAGVDKGYSIVLIEYLIAFKKLFANGFCPKSDILSFINQLAKLMQTGLYNDSFLVLLNYLINENMNYSRFNLPRTEARELFDFVSMGQRMQLVDPNVIFEKMPKNIQKAHNVMAKNEAIVSTPRPEEFEAAIKSYSFVNDDTDEDFVFFAPPTELELLNEGNILHHCVASYRDRIIDFGCKVVLMRRKGDEKTPFVTVEYENGDILQIKEKFNEDVVDAIVLDAADRWSTRAHRREKKGR